MKKKKYRLQFYDEKTRRYQTACPFVSKKEALFMLMEHGKRARVIYGNKILKKNYVKFGSTYYKSIKPV